MKIKKKTILLIPSVKKGNGTGHIKRCTALSERLQSLGADTGILVDSSEARRYSCYSAGDVEQFLTKTRGRKPQILTDSVASDWDVCIFDTRQARTSRLNSFNGISLCIGIDEGGAAREFFDYLIDILPNLEKTDPNISSTGFLQLPDVSKAGPQLDSVFNRNTVRILITFGGEDQSDLTGKFLSMMEDTGIVHQSQLTVVEGPLFKKPVSGEGWEILKAPANLGTRLREWDLVITSFGLTCFEALYSGVPVLLFNPSAYHRSLAIRSGIPEIGVNNPDAGRLEDYLNNPQRLYRAVENYSGAARLDLASYILGLSVDDTNICRGCGRKHHKIMYRTLEFSFFRCFNCGMVNQQSFGKTSIEYGKEYFFEDYRKQYGRTYLEDFNNIKAAGLVRCAAIGRLSAQGNLLDIGCGYGPFLSAADDSGYNVFGIDISKDAVAYTRDELGFRTAALSFEDFNSGTFELPSFDVISMWFVIEHLAEPAQALRRVNSLLRKGGVFAFATPNYDGITRRRSMRRFLDANPLDHYTLWSPWTARRLLKKYGFKLKYIRTPVVHQERFFRDQDAYRRLNPRVRKILDWLLGLISRVFLLGDTFEVYAVKLNDR
ncbi:MAG: class I SAM-dependent methyltransferase [Spirochaetales bacterium]|nr:class I SAM-dependent methyltransferase [Spirochaetales bacterium]